MNEKRGSGILYVGIDESNHGRVPEIYTAVFSEFPSDVNPCYSLEKQRQNHQKLWAKLKRRDYSFLFVEKRDRYRFDKDLLGVVVASLVVGSQTADRQIKIFVDALEKQKINRLRSMVAELTGIEKKFLLIESGNDEVLPLVNYADELAHFLFRHATLGAMATKYKSHRKELLI